MTTFLLHAGIAGHVHSSDFVIFAGLALAGAISLWLQVRQ